MHMRFDYLEELWLWMLENGYGDLWFHETTSFGGYRLRHVLNNDGREVARWIDHHHWEVRRNPSPEQWLPLPDTVKKLAEETIFCLSTQDL